MWYLKSAFDTYEKVQGALQNRLGEVQSAILSPVEMVKQLLGATASPKEPAEPQMDALRKRVAELEARLAESSKGKQAVRRRPRRKV